MNVRELIAKLQELDPELPVGVESGYCEDTDLATEVYVDKRWLWLPDPDREGYVKGVEVESVWLK